MSFASRRTTQVVTVAVCLFGLSIWQELSMSSFGPAFGSRQAWATPPQQYTGPPKPLYYDAAKDNVRRYESVATRNNQFPSMAARYYGNRLNKYIYTGKPGTGGIYDAIEDGRVRRNLDPKKYRYAW